MKYVPPNAWGDRNEIHPVMILETKNRPYSFRVKNTEGEYESWTGTFRTKKKAMRWYNMYGQFHEERGHKIELFHVGEIVKNWKSK